MPQIVAPYLKEYHNIHKGMRCFICATGPSLNKTPIEYLQEEHILGTNTFFKHSSISKSKYLFISDPNIWSKYKEETRKVCCGGITKIFKAFVKQSKDKTTNEKEIFVPGRPGPGSLHEWNRRFQLMPELENWGDLRYGVYRGNTVVAFALQAAYHMVYTEVYLLGCDCHYSNDGNHHFDGTKVDFYCRKNWSPIFKMYEICKKVFENDGRKIYNATFGGKLEVFERIDFKNFYKGKPIHSLPKHQYRVLL